MSAKLIILVIMVIVVAVEIFFYIKGTNEIEDGTITEKNKRTYTIVIASCFCISWILVFVSFLV